VGALGVSKKQLMGINGNIKIEEFMEKDLALQLEDITFNINKFKKFCNGK